MGSQNNISKSHSGLKLVILSIRVKLALYVRQMLILTYDEIGAHIGAVKFSKDKIYLISMCYNEKMAEEVGFEPTVGLHPRRFSRPLP